MMGTLLAARATTASWPIVGQVAWLLGKVMNFIYMTLDKLLPTDNGLIGWSIIIYTLFVYALMIPITIKQQKQSKMTSVMNPEIQAIQKKYKNKKDQASMVKQQEEIQQVYDKYGSSMTSGCLPLVIQMILLFALYPVIYDMETYVPAIKNAGAEVQKFLTIPDMSMSPLEIIKARDTFDMAPVLIIITCIVLPVLSGLTQYISIKLSQSASGQELDKDNPMAGTMNTMNMTMPIFSIFMVFTFSSGIGVYWVISAVVRCIQQIFINKHLSKFSVEDMIEKNKEKALEKQRKRGEKAEKINEMAQTNTRSIKSTATKSTMTDAKREEIVKQAADKAMNAKEGSLASKASMVKKFNENNKR